MKRKLLALVLSVLLVLSLLAGCGSGSDDSASSTAAPTDSASDSTAQTEAPAETQEPENENPYYVTDEPVTLTLWTSMLQQAMSYVDTLTDGDAYQKAFELTNVTIESVCVPSSNVADMFNIMIASEEYCDLINNAAQYSTGLDGAIEDGVIIDMKDYLEADAPNYMAAIADHVPEVTTEGGHMGAIYQVSTDSLTNMGIVIRQDWLDEANLDVPVTYDDLHEALVAFKTNNDATMWVNQSGLLAFDVLNAGYDIAAYSEGFMGFYPFRVVDGTVDFCWETDEFRDFLTMMSTWYSEGLIYPDFATSGSTLGVDGSNAFDDFLNGKIGVALAAMNDLENFPLNAGEGQESMKLAAMGTPLLNENDTDHIRFKMPAVSVKWSISTSCDEALIDTAVKFMDFLYSDVGSQLASYGVEGVTYTVSGGEPVFTDLVLNNEDGLAFSTVMSIYALDEAPGLIDCDRESQVYSEAAFQAAKLWGNGDAAHAYPLSCSLNTSESETFNSIYSEIETYGLEHITGFIVGNFSVENDWDSFVSTMQSMGSAQLTALKQAAYDRYIG